MNRDDVPDQWRPVYNRAMNGKSRAAAIKAHCLMCCGWNRGEVVRCTATGCPLHPYRPGASSPTLNCAPPPPTGGLDAQNATSEGRMASGAAWGKQKPQSDGKASADRDERPSGGKELVGRLA